jgi:hypothetical protein
MIETKEERKRFLVYSSFLIAAVVIARMWNIVLGDISLIVRGVEIHHFYPGIGVVGAGLYLSRKELTTDFTRLAVLGFGTGMVTDELSFILLTPDTYSHYFTPISTLGAAASSAAALGLYLLILKKKS